MGLVRQFPEAGTVNLGGGYKIGRMAEEKSTDLQLIGGVVKKAFAAFERATGRILKLEIEPGI